VGGKYRLIDIPISNCVNSGYGRVFVITQFNTASLHRHISRTYSFDALSERSVEILAAEQTLEDTDWYQGTADAVRQNLRHLRLHDASHVLILSGDHLCRMDYRQIVYHHDNQHADVTLAAQPVTAQQAREFGVLKLAKDGTVPAFAEKPNDEATLREFAVQPPQGRDPASGEPLTHLASLGIYVFRPAVLRELLESSTQEDFGRQIIPLAISRCRVSAFPFGGYWEDIGTIATYYRASLELTDPLPRFNLYDQRWPIYTRPRYLPPAKLDNTRLRNALIADGAVVSGSEVERSIVGLRTIVRDGCQIRNSVLMGQDFYEHASPAPPTGRPAPSRSPRLGIGPECRIEGAIVDKNVRIGEGVTIRGRPGSGHDRDESLYCVRDGIVIIPRAEVVPAGTHIEV
jgi:glucose-1-phosphate adenylyltransferase